MRSDETNYYGVSSTRTPNHAPDVRVSSVSSELNRSRQPSAHWQPSYRNPEANYYGVSSSPTRNHTPDVRVFPASSELNYSRQPSNQPSYRNPSATPSTPSEYYDADAENIDPNVPNPETFLRPYPNQNHVSSVAWADPAPTSFRAANILRDSQAYPVSSETAPARFDEAFKDIETIVAPIPLPYSARSKDVLSAMISPVQRPPKFTKRLHSPSVPKLLEHTVGDESRAHPASTLPVSAIVDPSSDASRTLNYDYSRELAKYTIVDVPLPSPVRDTRARLRSVSPATLMALTEPFLMAWCNNYPLPQPIPKPAVRKF
ncbi:hypothetical protein B0H10DRAFT_2207030 [Mycena sp. CBHHK59/15]|nr:hypothetical protein B0H10DRAFT_2207030 [Mycena sp. CBHHK59/15]